MFSNRKIFVPAKYLTLEIYKSNNRAKQFKHELYNWTYF